jgi:HAD superfamily hydrolase (TIGR01484 family)
MRPIADLDPGEARGLGGVLFDLDDTLLDRGQLTEGAYSALHRLHESGLLLLGVTGRPVGWADVLTRQWPVRGIVAENGAVAVERVRGATRRWDAAADSIRQTRRARLSDIVAVIREACPALEPADDNDGRLTDFAFDIGERRSVSEDVIDEVTALARRQGARVARSSVHLHVSYDKHDKASGCARFLVERIGDDAAALRRKYVYIGDSENDESCFAAFRTTIAVSNLRGRFAVPPRFVTRESMGAGFAEAAAVLVARRR